MLIQLIDVYMRHKGELKYFTDSCKPQDCPSASRVIVKIIAKNTIPLENDNITLKQTATYSSGKYYKCYKPQVCIRRHRRGHDLSS